MRAALAARCGDDSPPGAWRPAAAATGVSGADAFLCHLSRSISGALDRLAVSANAAREQIRLLRAARDTCVVAQSHCDELETSIETAETSKRVTLERELVVADAALECLRGERRTVTDAAASLNDAELAAMNAELTATLDAAEAQLLALPTSVVEPPHVGLVVDEPAMLTGVAAFGRVVAPRAVTAADLTLEGTPTYACPGCSLVLRLLLEGATHAHQFSDELAVSLGAAAAATHVEASLVTEAAAPQPLEAHISANVSMRCICISIVVPASAPVGSSVCFSPLTVFGQPAACLLGALRVEPPGPADLSPEHAAQLHAWLPTGGSSSPGAWVEVFRATTHGFGAAAFHTRCDGRTRLLVLVRAREGGWLFGGFTAVGFTPGPQRYVADPTAFLFSLTNALGRPEKLESQRTGYDLFYHPSMSASFSHCLGISDNADTEARSWTSTGGAYAESASTGAHPMAQKRLVGWRAAEVVAWVV